MAANYSVIPVELLEDDKLSWEAKGLAAYICHIDMSPGTFDSKSIELWQKCTETNSMDAYKELVDSGYIEDVIGKSKWGVSK